MMTIRKSAKGYVVETDHHKYFAKVSQTKPGAKYPFKVSVSRMEDNNFIPLSPKETKDRFIIKAIRDELIKELDPLKGIL